MAEKGLRWNLGDIVPRGRFSALYQSVESDLSKLTEAVKELSPEMPEDRFRYWMDFIEDVLERLSRLSGYCSLWEAADLNSQEAKLLRSRSDQLYIKYRDAVIPLHHWIKGLPVDGRRPLDEANARRLFQSHPDLSYVLSYMRSLAKYTLSPGEERIMSRKHVTGVGALCDVYDVVTNNFQYRFRPRGGRAIIFKEQEKLRNYFYSTRPGERQAAYRALFEPYQENLTALFLIYQAVVKDWASDSQLRGFASPISRRNIYNQVPDAAIQSLLDTVADNVGLFQEFFRLKAKLMGCQRLRRYDILAPVEKVDARVPLARAKELVLSTFRDFAPGFAARAEQVFKAKHIDTHPRPGKRSGAFCSNISPKVVPYVLLNYTGNQSSVFTLAHELGHAIHDLYASQHSISAAGTTLPLAETASTIAEVIVFERLLEQAGSDRVRRAMLLQKMVDSYATIVRQSYIVKYEIEAHRLVPQGVRADDLCGLYLDLLRSHLEKAVAVADEFRLEWAYIPHIFHTPFYCYAYSFGELLSLALYARYRSQGSRFVSKIEKILAYGSSQSPDQILKEVGIDMADRKFWQGSFDILQGWLNMLRKLS